MVRQELAALKGIVASLRTVQRAVEPYRPEFLAEARATVRFETAPGRQLQIDFGCHPERQAARGLRGERRVEIAGRKVKVFLFVATLGYSRRLHVRAFRHERQESWFDGMECAFLSFGGVPEEVLLDPPWIMGPRPGHRARCREPDGRLQCEAPGLCPALGLSAARLRTVPGADQGQDRASTPCDQNRMGWRGASGGLGA